MVQSDISSSRSGMNRPTLSIRSGRPSNVHLSKGKVSSRECFAGPNASSNLALHLIRQEPGSFAAEEDFRTERLAPPSDSSYLLNTNDE